MAQVNLTTLELKTLAAALGNHTRRELHGHITEDFGIAVADEAIPTNDSILSVLAGENQIHNLYGKLREAIDEEA